MGAETLLTGSAEKPFALALRREKHRTVNRGVVKTEIVELERVPLSDFRQEKDGTLLFSGEGHTLRAAARQISGGAEFTFEGEAGWSYEFQIPAKAGEAVFGGGEQYRKTNLRGEMVVNFVSEHIKASTIMEKALLHEKLYRVKEHREIGSYAPMPVFVTDRRRMILFDTTIDGHADFGGRDCFRFQFDACPKRLLLLKAASYEGLAGLLNNQIPNRQYLPAWCTEGMILGVQGGTQTVLDKTFVMLDAGAKICGVWSQDWSGEKRTVMGKQVWWNWEVDEKLYPGLKDAIQKLNARGVKFLAYINPYLVKGGKLYKECKKKGWLITKKDGSVYHIKSTTFDAGMLDLTNPDAVKYIKETLIGKNMLDLGVSGWMADFGEYLPGGAAQRVARSLGEDQPRGHRGIRREGSPVLHPLRLSRDSELCPLPLERGSAHGLYKGLRHALRHARKLLPGLFGRYDGALRYRRLLLLRQNEAGCGAVHPLDGDGNLLPAHAQP